MQNIDSNRIKIGLNFKVISVYGNFCSEIITCIRASNRVSIVNTLDE